MDPSTRQRIDEAAIALRRSLAQTVPATEDLAAEAKALSEAYRSGGPAPELDDPGAVRAYAASRMPATFAAAARAFVAAADRAPAFGPESLLDAGGGTGSTAWAARAVWPSIRAIGLVDRSGPAIDLGRRLAAASGDVPLAGAAWRLSPLADHAPADLVTAGYVLGELPAEIVATVIDDLWAATGGLLVIVEPGSRAGFATVLAARERLLAAGARIVAPCPGPEPCPVAASRATWCHFLARLERSPAHRRAKGATRSWEDEPFSYVAVARPEVVADPRPRVVLGRPRHHPGRVELRICADGRIETRVVSRREGPVYRAARDLAWGDAITMSGD
ncbi:MAG TPA: small ribosomal subunit Rsm22 family protein [Candidatus Limnocylindrales bacterium]|nr:small ribosomal subunit Rsm22 family protein [Candidatus Limnocylindrales bacterium]